MYTFTIEYSLRNGVNTQNRPLPVDVECTPLESEKYFKVTISTNKIYH